MSHRTRSRAQRRAASARPTTQGPARRTAGPAPRATPPENAGPPTPPTPPAPDTPPPDIPAPETPPPDTPPLPDPSPPPPADIAPPLPLPQAWVLPGAVTGPGLVPPRPAPLAGLVAPVVARAELGLSAAEFEVAVQSGEVWTVEVPGETADGPPGLMVLRAALDRLTAEPGFPAGLRRRLRLVGTVTGSDELGVPQGRFARLARAGCFRPSRWYVNRYRAVVWLYPADEVTAFAAEHPSWLTGRLPDEVRSRLADGLDLRACGWRLRRAQTLAGLAPDAWHEAAVWLALLGPGGAADLVPDAPMGRRLAAARPVVRPPRRRAGPDVPPPFALVAEDPVEVSHARLALAAALARAGCWTPPARPTPPPTVSPPTTPPERTGRQDAGTDTAPPEAPGAPAPVAGGAARDETVTRSSQRWRRPVRLSPRAHRQAIPAPGGGGIRRALRRAVRADEPDGDG